MTLRPYKVEEQADRYSCPAKPGVRLGLLVEVVDRLGLGRQDVAQGRSDGLARVDAEFGGDEALHAGCNSGIDEKSLPAQPKGAERRHDSVLARQCFFQRVQRGVVDLLRLHAGGEAALGAIPSQDRHAETRLGELGYDDAAQATSTLCCSSVSRARADV